MMFGLGESGEYFGYRSDFSQGYHDYIEEYFTYNSDNREFVSE